MHSIPDPLKAQIIFTLMDNIINELSDVIQLALECELGGVIVIVMKQGADKNPKL